MSSSIEFMQRLASLITLGSQNAIDKICPPKTRAEISAWLKKFAAQNPKLTAFLLVHIVLSGVPLVIFAVFSATIFIFSLLATILTALFVATLFSTFVTGVAFLVLIPVVLMTAVTATFIFFWGFCGYYVLKRFNKADHPPSEDVVSGDKRNGQTKGRIDFMDGPWQNDVSKDEDKEDDRAYDDTQRIDVQLHKLQPAKLSESNLANSAR